MKEFLEFVVEVACQSCRAMTPAACCDDTFLCQGCAAAPGRSSRRESSVKRAATEPQPSVEPVEMLDANDADLVATCLHPSVTAMSKGLVERLCADHPFNNADDVKRRARNGVQPMELERKGTSTSK